MSTESDTFLFLVGTCSSGCRSQNTDALVLLRVFEARSLLFFDAVPALSLSVFNCSSGTAGTCSTKEARVREWGLIVSTVTENGSAPARPVGAQST